MLGALSATAALLSACSTGPGPLGDGGSPGQQCSPARQGQTITMGIYHLENSSSSPVTVQSVSLGSPDGLTMTKSWLVPIEHVGGTLDLVGAGWPYPPGFSQPVRWAWALRKPAVGAVIRAHQDLNLVFGLRRTTAKSGRSDGAVIGYTAGGSTYTLAENVSLVVAPKC
jgi:hypothetical protein